MIISHKYKYVFVELPLTASSAIAKELIENYAGESILFKHCTYAKFLKQATEEESNYFVFSGMRNPLDRAVSHYFKYKTDHNNKFSNPRSRKKGKHIISHLINNRRHHFKYRFVNQPNVGFQDFFLKYYKLPYSDWSLMHHDEMDYIIKFENIQEDFNGLLQKLKIEKIRDLPQFNKTSSKSKSFIDYYESQEVRRRAIKVFYWYMKKWNYEFPEDWKNKSYYPSKLNYDLYNKVKKIYWRFLH